MRKACLLSAALALALLSGCAHIPRFTKRGATQDEFLKARYECLKQVPQHQVESGSINSFGGNYSSAAVYSCGALGSCLANQGFLPDDEGAFSVPKELAVQCSR